MLVIKECLSEMNIVPGEKVLVFKNDKLYGVCGLIYATQIETNRQIEYKGV